ncbi:MAG: hypothetical protein HY231_21805 [Acidobacteria bacterium]|nr:hypothetical protein [Acidobacteriota bacterium]
MKLHFLDKTRKPMTIDVPAVELLKILHAFKREMIGADRVCVNEFFIWLDTMPRRWKPDEARQQQFYAVEELEAILNLEKSATGRSRKTAQPKPPGESITKKNK